MGEEIAGRGEKPFRYFPWVDGIALDPTTIQKTDEDASPISANDRAIRDVAAHIASTRMEPVQRDGKIEKLPHTPLLSAVGTRALVLTLDKDFVHPVHDKHLTQGTSPIDPNVTAKNFSDGANDDILLRLRHLCRILERRTGITRADGDENDVFHVRVCTPRIPVDQNHAITVIIATDAAHQKQLNAAETIIDEESVKYSESIVGSGNGGIDLDRGELPPNPHKPWLEWVKPENLASSKAPQPERHTTKPAIEMVAKHIVSHLCASEVTERGVLFVKPPNDSRHDIAHTANDGVAPLPESSHNTEGLYFWLDKRMAPNALDCPAHSKQWQQKITERVRAMCTALKEQTGISVLEHRIYFPPRGAITNPDCCAAVILATDNNPKNQRLLNEPSPDGLRPNEKKPCVWELLEAARAKARASAQGR